MSNIKSKKKSSRKIMDNRKSKNYHLAILSGAASMTKQQKAQKAQQAVQQTINKPQGRNS